MQNTTINENMTIVIKIGKVVFVIRRRHRFKEGRSERGDIKLRRDILSYEIASTGQITANLTGSLMK